MTETPKPIAVMPDGTPITAADVLARDLQSILQKVKAGKPLSAWQRKALEDAGRAPKVTPAGASLTPSDDRNDPRQKMARMRARDRAWHRVGKPAHPRRMSRCRNDPAAFLRAYFPAEYCKPFGPDQLADIRAIADVIRDGGRYLTAAPRGDGKTSRMTRMALWALLYGFRRFVVIVAAEQGQAADISQTLLKEFLDNDLIAEDWPDIAGPLRKTDGAALAAKGITDGVGGPPLGMEIRQGKRSLLRLPYYADTQTGGGVIRSVGLTGNLRGMFVRSPGAGASTWRPDLLLIDDPQTDESAASPSQTDTRERLVTRTIAGLAGPRKKIAMAAAVTVVATGDLSTRLLDRNNHPEWYGAIHPLVKSWPAAQATLWKEYADLWKHSRKTATAFYREHRKDMDAGAAVAWQHRYRDGEVSAVQNAENLLLEYGEAGFAAEFQNAPIVIETSGDLPTAEQLQKRANGIPLGTVPAWATHLTAFVDCGTESGLHWAVCAWAQGFTGAAVAWGRHDVDMTGGRSTEAALTAALAALLPTIAGRDWPSDNGPALRVARCFVDSGSEWATTVYNACRGSPLSGVLTPSKGEGVKAGRPMAGTQQPRPGAAVGEQWIVAPVQAGRAQVRLARYNTNHWKDRTVDRLQADAGAPGALTFNGPADGRHLGPLVDHLTSETRRLIEDRTAHSVGNEWEMRPARRDNHWFDCLVGCAVAASALGIKAAVTAPAAVPLSAPPSAQPQRPQATRCSVIEI